MIIKEIFSFFQNFSSKQAIENVFFLLFFSFVLFSQTKQNHDDKNNDTDFIEKGILTLNNFILLSDYPLVYPTNNHTIIYFFMMSTFYL